MKKENYEDKRIKVMNEYALVIIVFVGIICVIAPALVYGLSERFGKESDSIATTIAGITAPIIGLLSAVLIYFSFTAQVRANERIQEQIGIVHQETNFQFMREELKDLRGSFDNLEIMGYGGETGILLLAEGTFELFYEPDPDDESPMNLRSIGQERAYNNIHVLSNYINGVRKYYRRLSKINLSSEHRDILSDKFWGYYSRYGSSIFSYCMNLNLEGEDLEDPFISELNSIKQIAAKGYEAMNKIKPKF